MCPRCGGWNAYELVKLRRWQCAGCRHQVSLTAGTIFQNTRTPLTAWFWAAYLMTTDKRGVSALLLQRQLGLPRYETAWMMLHKFRRAMVSLAREPLWGEVEVDETWVGSRGCGKTRSWHGTHPHGGHPGFQAHYPDRLPETKRGVRFNDPHGRSQKLHWIAGGWLPTCATQSATTNRLAQRRQVSSTVGRPRYWQSATMAHWNLSRREPEPAPGLSG